MITYETHRLMVCVDCLFLLANGEMCGESTKREAEIHTRKMAEQWPLPWELSLGDSENDHEFSSSSCDACNSHLGGSRHEAWAMSPIG